MLLLVYLQRTGLYEGFLANDTNIWSLARMCTLMTNDMALMMESFPTNATCIWTFVGVRSAVSLQVKALEERLAAIITDVVALLQMISLYVLLHIKQTRYLQISQSVYTDCTYKIAYCSM